MDYLKSLKGSMILISFTILLFMVVFNIAFVFQIIGGMFSVCFPFVLGACIAFVLNIPMNFIENKCFKVKNKLSRTSSLLLAILTVFFIVFIVLFLVIPELVQTVSSLSSTFNDFILNVDVWIYETFNNPMILSMIESVELNWESIFNEIMMLLQNGAGSLISSSMNVTVSIVSWVITGVVAFIFSIYILLQKETLARQLKKVLYALFKSSYVQTFYKVSSLSYTTFCNFIAGQCLEAFILGSMFFVVMLILNMPYALLVGVLLCVTALIPIVGGFIGCFVGAFLIMIQDPMQALLFLVVFVVIQQIEGNLIYPIVVGNSVGLPSIWVLVSVTVGGSLFGIVGMLVAIPIVSVLYTLFREFVLGRLEERKIVIE